MEPEIPTVSSFQRCRNETIGRKTIGQILEAGRRAPSPGRVQSAEFIVIESDKRKVSELAGDGRLEQAPTLVAVVVDRERLERNLGSGAGRFAEGEAAVAVQNMRVAAERHGISSLWVGGFDRGRIGKALKVPEGREVAAVVGFAYTDDPVEQDPKFAMNDVVFYDFYDNQIDSQFDGIEWKGLYDTADITNRVLRRWVGSARRKLRHIL
jgi:nitroreductase